MGNDSRSFVSSFASTAQEWHYLAAGLSVGFAAGLYYGGTRLKPAETEKADVEIDIPPEYQ